MNRKEDKDIKVDDMAIVAVEPEKERLYKVVKVGDFLGERYDPRTEKDSGSKRQFAPTYLDKNNKNAVWGSTRGMMTHSQSWIE